MAKPFLDQLIEHDKIVLDMCLELQDENRTPLQQLHDKHLFARRQLERWIQALDAAKDDRLNAGLKNTQESLINA